MKPAVYLVLFVLGALWSTTSSALYGSGSNVIDVVAVPDALEADPYLTYLEDHDRSLTIEDFLKGNARDQLLPSPGHVLNRGYGDAAIWIRLQLKVGPSSMVPEVEKVLEISYPLLDHIRVYQVTDNQVTHQWETGDTLPFSQRPVDHNSYLFPIQVKQNHSNDIYIRVVSNSSLRIPLMLWDPIHFYQTQKSLLLIEGLYYGILFLMFFYNLCLYLTVRDSTYLYYILYIVAMVTFQSAMNGFGFEFIWPELPAVNDYVVGVSICTIAVFMMLFARKILETSDKVPRFDKVIRGLILIQPVLILMCFILPYSIIIKPVILNALISSLIMITLGIALATQTRTAKLFLIAWITMLVGAMLLAAVSLGWVEANILTTNAFILGSAIEVTLLSFTLAERMRSIQHRQTEMEKDAKLLLQKANNSLIESNQLKDEFLATISHELRTPMNGVIGCLENIRGEIKDNRLAAYIDSADRSAQQMMLLVDGILTYTEIHSHGLRLERSPFEVEKLVQTVRDFYQDSAKAKGLALNINISDEVPKLLIGDRRQLFQIIGNLVDNAIKFTPSGSVSVLFEANSLSQEKETANLNIRVIDTGIGIGAEKSQLIFEKFRQADGSFHRIHGGLGIGLAICKELSDLMGATLTFDSGKEGTEFKLNIELPYVRTNEQEATETSESAEAGEIPGGLTALVVEDNPVNQMVLKGILKKLSFTVLTAENGQVAVDILKDQLVDVVLMDCQMPVKDGFEATREIRQLNNSNATVTIIAVTANAMARDRDNCLEAGMNDYLSKPVKAHQIRQMLGKWLHNRKAA